MACSGVLGAAPLYSLSPTDPGSWMKLPLHEDNNLAFSESKLYFDELKGGTIFPGHLDDPVDIGLGEGYSRGFHCIKQLVRL
jgi:hypothetical protein